MIRSDDGPAIPDRDALEDLRATINDLENEVSKLRRELFPSSDFGESVRTGARVRVDPRVRMHSSEDALISLADDVNVYRGAELFGPLSIGRGTFLNRDVYVKPGVNFGARVAVGPFSRFMTEGHEIGVRASRAGKKTVRPITVEDGAWIGGDVTVLGGVTIGAGAVVASGALVNRDVPANALVAGVPAKVVRIIGAEATPASSADQRQVPTLVERLLRWLSTLR
ncbi:hypothetical protein ACQXVK_13165 [Curtobacterium sp. AB451]|uniref:acyltransferase n=1 Tax=Curtobacterium sp. AB451 TaxID=3422306 RepID=UPI003D337DFB